MLTLRVTAQSLVRLDRGGFPSETLESGSSERVESKVWKNPRLKVRTGDIGPEREAKEELGRELPKM